MSFSFFFGWQIASSPALYTQALVDSSKCFFIWDSSSVPKQDVGLFEVLLNCMRKCFTVGDPGKPLHVFTGPDANHRYNYTYMPMSVTY